MAKFLSRAEVYRIIQRELPPDTYPDGAPSAFWSTADSDATAKVVSTLYANMERVYVNNWVQTADERMVDWEVKVFGAPIGGSLTLQQRRDRALARLRTRPTLHPGDMEALIESYIGESGDDYDWDYFEWAVVPAVSGFTPSWSLGISQLGYDTYLSGGRGLLYGPEGCDLTAEDLGMTSGQFLTIRAGFATVELRIFEDELPDDIRSQLQVALDRFGRASRYHVIHENVSLEFAPPDVPFYFPPLDEP